MCRAVLLKKWSGTIPARSTGYRLLGAFEADRQLIQSGWRAWLNSAFGVFSWHGQIVGFRLLQQADFLSNGGVETDHAKEYSGKEKPVDDPKGDQHRIRRLQTRRQHPHYAYPRAHDPYETDIFGRASLNNTNDQRNVEKRNDNAAYQSYSLNHELAFFVTRLASLSIRALNAPDIREIMVSPPPYSAADRPPGRS